MAEEKNEASCTSRSAFLTDAGLMVGGITIACMAINSACKEKVASTDVISSNCPAQSTIIPAIFASKLTTATDTGSKSTDAVYTLPSEAPPTLNLPNVSYTIATDRLYSTEHIWVKSLSSDIVIIGVTDKLQSLMGAVIEADIYPEGSVLTSGRAMGNLYAEKINVEIIAPVSGVVLQLNDDIKLNPAIINYNPYVKGWILIIQLSKPGELQDLLTPESYIDLIS